MAPKVNYFAHLTLAQDNTASKVGNLMGDFMRGVRLELLPAPLQRGISNHRMVDRFTDQHPAVIACKPLFSPQCRRFAGVALDVLFDHLLIVHWERFYTQSLTQVIANNYAHLEAGKYLMPAAMQVSVEKMIEYDWFNHYRQLDNIGQALDRIASRIRFVNHFDASINDIRQYYTALETAFLTFYPQLVAEVGRLQLESPSPEN